jgi:hypothetical protein
MSQELRGVNLTKCKKSSQKLRVAITAQRNQYAAQKTHVDEIARRRKRAYGGHTGVRSAQGISEQKIKRNKQLG